MAKELFLGLDLSTQSLTAVVIDLSKKEIRQNSLNFDDRYPSYKTEGGVIICEDSRLYIPIPECGLKPWMIY